MKAKLPLEKLEYVGVISVGSLVGMNYLTVITRCENIVL